MEEIWKDILGFEGMYQVSNLGRVKGVTRTVKRSDDVELTIQECILAQGTHRKGYKQVSLSKDKKKYCFKVHKLVAMAFLTHTPCGMSEIVDHINNNRIDNRAENLQLTTNRHNASKDKKNCSSKFLGASASSNKKAWVSYIRIGKSQKYLGTFKCEFAASVAYHKALKELQYF